MYAMGLEAMDCFIMKTLHIKQLFTISEQFLDIKSYKLSEGRNIQYMDIKNRNSVCIVGSYVDLAYFGGQALGDTIKLNGRDFTIVGVIDEQADSEEYSTDDCVYVPYSTISRILEDGMTVHPQTDNENTKDNE